MALATCKECGGKVSTDAASCPHCGRVPPKKPGAGTLFIGGIAAFVVGSMIVESNRQAPPSPAPVRTAANVSPVASAPTPPTQADIEINQVLRGARAIKASIKKPESFELLSATMMPSKVICYEYAARNSFNDRVTEHFVLGAVGDTTKMWNRYCAGKSGTNYTHVRAVL